ncbi:MAG: hypothetical protein D3906_02225 [Candidatus Electrothrix sp. AUS1_2]|nr:hypothetical protein [Candidatus Electrothrix sp. AUS1_2]
MSYTIKINTEKRVSLKVQFFRLSGALQHLFLLRCSFLPAAEHAGITPECLLIIPIETGRNQDSMGKAAQKTALLIAHDDCVTVH